MNRAAQLLDDGHNLVIPFATSDWSKLSPDIVQAG